MLLQIEGAGIPSISATLWVAQNVLPPALSFSVLPYEVRRQTGRLPGALGLSVRGEFEPSAKAILAEDR